MHDRTIVVEWNEYTCLLAYLRACLLVDYRPPLLCCSVLFLLLLLIGFVFWATIRDSSIQVTVVRPNRIKPALGRSIVYVSLLTLSSLILILMPSCVPTSNLNLFQQPAGGVHSGQILRIPIVSTTQFVPQKGRWKDGLFSCFRLGLSHPALCNAVLCPQLLLGQILLRMNMTWLISPSSPMASGSSMWGGSGGNTSTTTHDNNNNNIIVGSGGSTISSSSIINNNNNNNSSNVNNMSSNNNNIPNNNNQNNSGKTSGIRNTMRKIVTGLILFSLYDAIMAPPLLEFNVNQDGEVVLDRTSYSSSSSSSSALWHQLFYLLLSLPMSIYGIYVVVKLRAAIRAKYGIPTGRLGRLEDVCCVFCCNCCVVAQMARQTADYDDEPASYCSSNGLMAGNPPKKTTTTTTTTTIITTKPSRIWSSSFRTCHSSKSRSSWLQ
jgi:Cys-rich protein (TIGR01571 family)